MKKILSNTARHVELSCSGLKNTLSALKNALGTLTFQIGAVSMIALLALSAPSFSKDKANPFKWSKNTLAIIASGNAELGEELAESAECSGCHGETGISEDGEFPSLAGQPAAYLVKQLYDYKHDHRATDTMKDFAEELDMKQMADIAAFYAAQKPPKMAGGDVAPKLAVDTDKARFVVACDKCHGIKGVGRGFDVPRLAGQQKDYFLSTMEAFKEGERSNDHYGRMRHVAKSITDKELKALADYYAMVPEE